MQQQTDFPRLRPALIELIAHAEASPGSDEAHFLGQLRAAIAGIEGRAAPFHPRGRSGRPDSFGRVVARYLD